MKKYTLFLLFCLFCIQASAQETLKIDWPEDYNWKLLSNHEDEKLQILEIIPENQSGDDWTLLGQQMAIKGSTQISMEDAKVLMYDQTKKNSPGAVLTELNRNETASFPWILFKIECPNFKTDVAPESQLWHITKSENALYVTFVATKKSELAAGFTDMWSNILLNGKIIQE